MAVRAAQRTLDLPDEILHQLRAETELYAAELVNRYRWKGDPNGVLPEGHDSASIASQAWLQLVQQLNHRSGHKASQSPEKIRDQLHYYVRKEINRLHHRKENRCLRNEPDLARVYTDDGEPLSPVHSIPGPGPDPSHRIIWSEDYFHIPILQSIFLAFLGKQRRLKTLFHHLCQGCSDPKKLARKLKLTVPAILKLKRRLRDRIRAFQRRKKCENIKIRL